MSDLTESIVWRKIDAPLGRESFRRVYRSLAIDLARLISPMSLQTPHIFRNSAFAPQSSLVEQILRIGKNEMHHRNRFSRGGTFFSTTRYSGMGNVHVEAFIFTIINESLSESKVFGSLGQNDPATAEQGLETGSAMTVARDLGRVALYQWFSAVSIKTSKLYCIDFLNVPLNNIEHSIKQDGNLLQE